MRLRASATGVGQRLCLAGAALGALGLIGWATGTHGLIQIVPGEPPMMPNTALGLVLAGIAGALLRSERASNLERVLATIAAGVVLVIGLGTAAEYALALDLRIDLLLVHAAPGPHPGRPSPLTAVGLCSLGAALLLMDIRPRARVRLAELAALFAGVIAITGLLGQLMGAGPLYRLARAPVVGVAPHTAIALLLTSLGLLLERPSAGIMSVATSRGPGGVVLRRLLLPAMLAPVLLGIAVTRAFAALHVEQFALVTATASALMTLIGPVVLTFTAVLLNRVHEALELSRTQTRALIDLASDAIFVADLDGRYTEVNDAACRLLGMSREVIIGKTIIDLIPADEVERLLGVRERLMRGGIEVSEWHLRDASGEYIPVEVSAKILPDGRWQGFVRDIRERKAAEEVARHAQARIEGIVSIAADAIISIDEAQRISMFNRGAEQIFGWSAREALGQPLDLLIPERLRSAHRADVNGFAVDPASARKMGDRARSIQGVRKDGSEFPAEAAISKLRLGEQTTFTVVLRDMTERAALERGLRDARGFLENVLASSEHAVIALDLERRVVLWNDAACRDFGHSADEMIGAPVERLHTREDRATGTASALYARALEDGHAESVLRLLHKRRAQLVVHMVVSRRLDAAGKPIGYLIVSRDVTSEQRRAERQKLLAEVGPLLTSSLDRSRVLEGALQLFVRDLADVCIADLGEQPGDERGARVCEVAVRDVRKQALATALASIELDRARPHLTWAALQTRRTTLVTHVAPEYIDELAQDADHRRLLRELAPVSIISVPLQVRDLQFGALAFVSCDALRRYDEDDAVFAEDLGRRLASALENARLFELATRAIRARDEVLSVVAHDLRNPLAAASLAAASLVRSQSADQAQVSDAGPRIQRAIARADRLIDDLLDLTRIERKGGMAIEAKPVAVDKLVLEAIEMLAPAAAEAEVTLEIGADPSRALAWADEPRVMQLLGNLIGNSLKFTPKGGRVQVAAERCGDELRFSVSDTGVGIPPEQLSHLFDRFWQARKTDRRGAGLGLAIAKGIVDAHGGRIWAESQVGRGTRFVFTLPLAPEAYQSAHEPPLPH